MKVIDLDKIKSKKKLSIGELALFTGHRKSTLKFFTEQGLINFEQSEEGLTRYYDKDKSVKRLNQIKVLKEKKRLTIEEIKEQLKTN